MCYKGKVLQISPLPSLMVGMIGNKQPLQGGHYSRTTAKVSWKFTCAPFSRLHWHLGLAQKHRSVCLQKDQDYCKKSLYPESRWGKSGESSALLQQFLAHAPAHSQETPMTPTTHFLSYCRQEEADMPPDHRILLDHCFIHQTVMFITHHCRI